MVVLSNANMYECRVLYIGSAPPIETLKGIEALQEPLRQRYPADMNQVEGIDANIRVLPTALEITYVASGQIVHFPLDRLQICAGVRAVNITDTTTGEKTRSFAPVNTLQQESRHPAIFAAIIRRNKGRQINECHAFVCNSTRDALHLVNATATANMALKGVKGNKTQYDNNSYENGIPVVHTAVVNGGETFNGTDSRRYTSTQSNNEIYVRSQLNGFDSQHYQIETPRSQAQEPETIYITFDKSNLKPSGENTLELQSRYEQRTGSPIVERRTFIEPVPVPRPMFVPQRVAVVPGPMLRPRPMMYARPMLPPPQPMLIRAPPPMMVRPPPPAPRLYTRRVISPPPAVRYSAPPPVFVRSRARSASPIRYARSEFRPSPRGQYQPKLAGKPASDSGLRFSRRDKFEMFGPPRQDMFMHERAFSRRMNADSRMSKGAQSAYPYPSAYDYQDVLLFDRPTTKSNPRYSSSSDSDDDRDNRFNRRSTKRKT